jgi:hypothetical protein
MATVDIYLGWRSAGTEILFATKGSLGCLIYPLRYHCFDMVCRESLWLTIVDSVVKSLTDILGGTSWRSRLSAGADA